MMERMGFDHGWIVKVMDCISIARFSFLMNGCPQSMIILGRDLCQGCPLSPYLFLICAETLSVMILEELS